MKKYLLVFILLLLSVSVATALPSADFSASPLTGNYTFNVFFTDLSTGSPVSWDWNFGDGTVNVTDQNPTHTYTFSGNFSPSLTVTDGGGNKSTLTKIDYISSGTGTTNSSSIDILGRPKLVQIKVQNIWGKAIPNATVTIQGISTTTGTWDWVITMLGIPLNEAPIQNTAMTGVTDSLGETEFLMVSTTKYNITTSALGYTFPAFYITPHDTEYAIVANPLGGDGWIEPTVINATMYVTVSVATMKTSDTNQGINITYTDTSLSTTGGFVNISQGDVVLTSHAIGATNNFTLNQTVIVPVGGTSVTVTVDTIVSGQHIQKSFVRTFAGGAVQIGDLPPDLIYWACLFIIIMTGLMAGATTSPQVSVLVCLEAWVFLGLGWLKPMADRIGNDKVAVLFMFATFVSVLWNFREGKRKETGR
jgi:PKD repeat protein